MMATLSQHGKSRRGGFTFVEMLVAISLSAIFFGAAALVLRSIMVNSKRLSSLVEVEIGTNLASKYYGSDDATLRVYSAPNYGQLAFAADLRDQILGDLETSEAVYCLPRSAANTVRPEFLRYPSGDEGSSLDHPVLDTPEAFRRFLAEVEDDAAAIFESPIRNVPATEAPNASIFLLAPETNRSFIRVRAVYDIDLVTPENLAGTYASVKRYENGILTNYYDVFYPAGDGDAFHPLFVAFEHVRRTAVDEGPDIDRFKIAPHSPFYLVWLPDPSINPYTKPAHVASDPATSPRAAYEHMSGRTGFSLVLPMFPSL